MATLVYIYIQAACRHSYIHFVADVDGVRLYLRTAATTRPIANPQIIYTYEAMVE
jgi:hypothetical protein